MPDTSSHSALQRLFAGRLFLFIVAANVLYYIAMVVAGVSPTSPTTLDLLCWGGNYAPLVMTGQGWRLLTSMFMHGGLIHLALNMFMLFQLGLLVEWRYGSVRFLVVYLLSGLGGGLLSAWWNAHHHVTTQQLVMGMLIPSQQLLPAVSVGASGAIMGLAGALFLAHYSRLNPDAADGGDSAKDVKAIGQVILINLGIGFVMKGIDQSAHIGGLVAGLVAGWLLIPGRFGLRGGVALGYTLLIGALGCAASALAVNTPVSDELKALRVQADAELGAQLVVPDEGDANGAPSSASADAPADGSGIGSGTRAGGAASRAP